MLKQQEVEIARKLEKLTDKHRFLLQIQNAVADYDRQRGKKSEKWSDSDLKKAAQSAAVQRGLSYEGGEVDDAIVKAIRITADPKNTEAEQKKARDDAWIKYSTHK